LLINKEAQINDIKAAVMRMTLEESKKMKNTCITRAKDFSLETFADSLKKYIEI
jgi:hypothetical protein